MKTTVEILELCQAMIRDNEAWCAERRRTGEMTDELEAEMSGERRAYQHVLAWATQQDDNNPSRN